MAQAGRRAGGGRAGYRSPRPTVERARAWLVARGTAVSSRGVEQRQGLRPRVAALNLRRTGNRGLVFAGSWQLPSGWPGPAGDREEVTPDPNAVSVSGPHLSGPAL